MGTAGRQLTAAKCKGCNQLFLFPRPICPGCDGTEWEEVRLSGQGKVATYTTIRVPPLGFEQQVPYEVIVVDLTEKLSVTGRLAAPEGKELKIGAPVSFIRQEKGVYWFQLED